VSLSLLLVVFGCSPKEYEYSKAYVYQTSIYPLRNNYFKMEIYYEFEKNGDTIKDIYSTHRLPIAFEGDSLVVKYPKGKPHKNEVIRIIRVKPTRRKL
jgi:hypothetical protein